METDRGLQAAVQYAKNGDPGALRFLTARFPGLDAETLATYTDDSVPFGAWATRVTRNKALAEEAAADGPPPEFVDELSEALRRLTPSEREALRRALSRSGD